MTGYRDPGEVGRELDSRLTRAIAGDGCDLVTDVAIRIARAGYQLAIEDAQRVLQAEAAKYRATQPTSDLMLRFALVADHCAGVIGGLKP